MTPRNVRSIVGNLTLLVTTLFATLPLSGCVMVGASSRGGFFIWPGGLGLIVVIIVVMLLLRRR